MALLKLAVLLGVASFTTAALNTNITSPPITNWGEWGNFEHCPNGRHAQGFQLRTEPNQFLRDDTAMNAIRLFCGDPFNPDTAVVTSTQGSYGTWGHVYTCYPAVLTGFQLRVESDQGSGDDTATNNARFICNDNPNDYIEGDGLTWGSWSTPQYCQSGQAICGIQTQIEPWQGDDGDDSVLNNVRLECCDFHKSDLQAGYDYVKENGAYPQKVTPEFAELLRKAVADEKNHKVANTPEDLAKLRLANLIRGKAGVRPMTESTENTESQSPQKHVSVHALLKEAIKKIQKEQSAKNEIQEEKKIFITRAADIFKKHQEAQSAENTKSQIPEEHISVYAKMVEAIEKIHNKQVTENLEKQNDMKAFYAKAAEILKKKSAENHEN